jgi:hypothetical protein
MTIQGPCFQHKIKYDAQDASQKAASPSKQRIYVCLPLSKRYNEDVSLASRPMYAKFFDYLQRGIEKWQTSIGTFEFTSVDYAKEDVL